MKTTDIKLKYKDHIQDPENLCNAFIHNVENDSLQVDMILVLLVLRKTDNFSDQNSRLCSYSLS